MPMNHSSVVSASIFIVAVLIMLLQLWFNIWSNGVFEKIMITVASCLAISLVISFVRKELKDINRIKNGGDLDK